MNHLPGVSAWSVLLSQVFPRLTLVDVLPLHVRGDIGPFLIAHCVHPLSTDGRLTGGVFQHAARTVALPQDNPTNFLVDNVRACVGPPLIYGVAA